MDKHIPAALVFLERMGWFPRRALRAWEEYQATPTEGKRQEAARCLDAVLAGFQRVMAMAIADMREAGESPRRLIRIGELEDLREEAARLMSRRPRPLHWREEEPPTDSRFEGLPAERTKRPGRVDAVTGAISQEAGVS
jgi:hypothetical protein